MRRNIGDDAFHIAQDVVVPETKDFVALVFEKARAPGVAIGVDRVLSAISLDDQPRAVRTEISEIATHGNLEAKPGRGEGLAQRTAQMFLGFSGFAS